MRSGFTRYRVYPSRKKKRLLTEGGKVQASFGPNYTWLAEVKSKYDPTNLFRLNQNIKPTK